MWFSSLCSNNSSNKGIIIHSNNSKISQGIYQKNLCLYDSNCSNHVFNEDIIKGNNDETKSKVINQRNICLINSECNNKGIYIQENTLIIIIKETYVF